MKPEERKEQPELKEKIEFREMEPAATNNLVEDSSSLLPSSYQAYSPEPSISMMVEPQAPECALSPEATQEQFPNLGDRYEVLALVGRGGMGVVYKVRDKAVDKVFAVKVLNHDLVQDKISVKRFEQEAKAASALTHANLAAVYDYGVGLSGCPFLVMDYLEGHTLEQELAQEGYFDSERALDIFIQAAEAMADSHLKGVIHRDIKPANIILEKAENGSDFVKLVDFGIAKVLPSEQKAHENLTQTGDIFGSPLYMSPEQCEGNMQDRRSDIYSLGCLMYETLTGVKPFAAENPIKIILRHIQEDPKPISSLATVSNRPAQYKVPSDLDKVILRCLARDPNCRYQSAYELVTDLKLIRDGEKVKFAQPLAMPLNEKHSKRERLVVLTLCLVLCMVAGIFIYRLSSLSPPATSLGHPIAAPNDQFADALNFDSKSYSYFVSGEYDKAAPLLEFGTKVYRDSIAAALKRGDDAAFRRDSALLNENFQHLGKCYMMMARQSSSKGQAREATELLNKAKANYDLAMPFYKKYGNYSGGQMPEFVTDFSEVLRKLDLQTELKQLKALAKINKIDI
ncbi:serine/threonine protein kinase [bacterium]|nr:serine/threonine protein kinase [bacterium]MBP9807916.1 serine/threonine protein kinase [bacterium]